MIQDRREKTCGITTVLIVNWTILSSTNHVAKHLTRLMTIGCLLQALSDGETCRWRWWTAVTTGAVGW